MRIDTLNCNGLRVPYRIHLVKNYIDKFKLDILFLQETFTDNLNFGRQIEQTLGGKIYWSLGQPGS